MAEMLCQSHWKTQIEGLTKRQFVQVSVHRARVCIRSKRRDKCSCSSIIFHVLSRQPPPPAPIAKDQSHGIKHPRIVLWGCHYADGRGRHNVFLSANADVEHRANTLDTAALASHRPTASCNADPGCARHDRGAGGLRGDDTTRDEDMHTTIK